MNTVKLSLNRKVISVAVVASSLSLIAAQQAGSAPSAASQPARKDVKNTFSIDSSSQSDPIDPAANAGAAAGASSTATISSSSSSAGGTSTSVTVNGQTIPVPENGTHQETISSPDGTTNVSVSNTSTSNGTAFNSSLTTNSLNVVNSTAGASVNVESHSP